MEHKKKSADKAAKEHASAPATEDQAAVEVLAGGERVQELEAALATFTGLIARSAPDLARALAVLFVIGILLLLALILFLLHRVKHELADDRNG